MLANLSCYLDMGGPRPPGAPIPISTDAAAELGALWESVRLVGDAESTVMITERQITSLLAIKMASYETPLFYDTQIYLRDGLLQLYGNTQQGPFRAAFLLAIQPLIDSEGGLSFAVVSAELGGSPAPDALLEGVSAILTEAFTGTLGSLATGLRIRTVEIADGLMILTVNLR